MFRKLTFLVFALLISNFIVAQTMEELKAQKEAKETALAPLKAQLDELTGKVGSLEGEIASLTDQITPYPRWDKGAFGTIGFNFANFSDWLSKDAPNTSAAAIGFALNGFANMDQEKYFWRNAGSLNLSWLKFDNKDVPDDEDGFQVAADAFNLSSLLGYKLNDKWAISGLGEYRTAMLRGKFNDPGYLDLGVGATWMPITNLVVVIHPLNYNFVFSDSDFDYMSSLGAKIVADYTKQLSKGVSWKSNFSTFISYEDPNELSNWTWVNTFSTAYKGIGIGLDIGLRGNKQESKAAELADNPLQTYYVLGLSYNL